MLGTSCYIIDQGYHTVRNQVAAVPVDDVRANPDISSEETAFFQHVDAIRRYATTEIGLAAGDNYRSYVQYDRDYLVDVVSAVDELSFTRK
ncbi:MAG: aminopeptidase, partial [Spirochaeta sp.]|nr:aminopeptidase [Spirochaeta sp.]